MEPHSQQLPETMSNKAFPMGDILFPEKIDAASQWFEDVGHYHPERYANYLQIKSKPVNNSTALCDNDTASLDLCRHWDTVQGENHKYALTGYVTANAFNNAVRLLPFATTDMTYELDKMRTVHPITARTFGRFAWNGMHQSHPSVSTQFDKLLELSNRHYDLQREDNEEYFIAGMMLPYVLAVFTRLEGYIKRDDLDKWRTSDS